MKLEDAISLALSPYTFSIVVIAIYWRELGYLGGGAAVAIAVATISLAPLAIVLYDTLKGRTDLFVSRREARPKYYLLTLLSYMVGVVASLALGLRPYIPLYACYFSVGITLFAINFRWKISVHTAGVAGPTVMLAYLFSPIYLAFLLLLVPVAWARCKLRAHTLAQVVGGSVVAIAVTLAILLSGLTF